MSESSVAPNRSRPWHLWVIGVLALVWNSIGAFDYLMTETRNASYMSSFTADQLAYFYGLPRWIIATWAVGVWGGVVGSVFLLLRRRLAVSAFGASLAGTAVTFLYNYALTDGYRFMGGIGAAAFSGVIILVTIALLAYSRRLSAMTVLR